jgi:hypothetical protein
MKAAAVTAPVVFPARFVRAFASAHPPPREEGGIGRAGPGAPVPILSLIALPRAWKTIGASLKTPSLFRAGPGKSGHGNERNVSGGGGGISL